MSLVQLSQKHRTRVTDVVFPCRGNVVRKKSIISKRGGGTISEQQRRAREEQRDLDGNPEERRAKQATPPPEQGRTRSTPEIFNEDADVRWPPRVLIDDRGPNRTGAAFKSFSHPEDFGKTEALRRRWAPPPRGQRLAARVSDSSGPRERPRGTNPTFKCAPPPRLPLSTDIDAGSDAAGVVKAAGAAIPPGLTTIPTSIPNSNVGIWCYCHGNRLVSVESEEKDMVHITDPHPRAQSRPESRTIQPRSCVWVDFLNSLPPFRTRKPPING